ncbi:MAG: hypothetical protein LBS54_04535 [Dysgonamonadaceae bacterium]|jgi:hypothetical protein|nr:hypothetical protein [Dysgonamonadaceae bacterium]
MNETTNKQNSRIESGINTNVDNLGTLIGVCISFDGDYDPSVNSIKIPSLQELMSHVRHAINDVDYFKPLAERAESARQEKFAVLPILATRIQAAAIVHGLPPSVIANIKEIVRKIRGARKKKINLDAEYTGIEPPKHISVSQVSFAEQIEHFTQLVMHVSTQPEYTPKEDDLKVPALNAFQQELGIVNDSAKSAEQSLTDARDARNKLLYTPETGMIDTALRVKEYVKSVFGAKSSQYKEVFHIKFENKKIV